MRQTPRSHQLLKGEGPYSRTTFPEWRTLSRGGLRKCCICESLWLIYSHQLCKRRSGHGGLVHCAKSRMKPAKARRSVTSATSGYAEKNASPGKGCQPRSTKQFLELFVRLAKIILDCDAPAEQEHNGFPCEILIFWQFLCEYELNVNIHLQFPSKTSYFKSNREITGPKGPE